MIGDTERAHDNQDTKTAHSQNVWVIWKPGSQKPGNRREEKGLERSKMGVGVSVRITLYRYLRVETGGAQRLA